MMDLIAGRVREIRVHVRELPITAEMHGDYDGDAAFRQRFQTWVNDLWQAKDAQIEVLQDG
jgi:hypothetical protein